MVRTFIQKVKRRETGFYAALYFTAKSIRTMRVPSGFPFRQFFGVMYYLHVFVRETIGFLKKFLYFEPMFRSRCEFVGHSLNMELLPYISGNGSISIGNNCTLSGMMRFGFNDKVHDEVRISVGDHTFIGHQVALNAAREIRIGSHCLIAQGVRISDFDGHPISPEARRSDEMVQCADIRSVVIEDDVWIGHGTTILKGVRIGAGSVIGAQAVVTRDIPPRSIAVGNPARVIGTVDEHARKVDVVDPATIVAEGVLCA